jgi:anti-anti-sigma factor
VDLSGLSFIDSSGIGILIAAFQESSGNQMRVVVGSGTQVDRVFRIAGVADALPVYHDRAAALVAMPNPENDQGDAGT